MRQERAALNLPRRFANLLRFYRQAETQGGRIERCYQIAGHTICLRFAGQALIPHFTAALAHLETTPTATPDLVVCLADQQSSGVSLPPMTWQSGLYCQDQKGLYFYLHEGSHWQEAFLPRFRLGLVALRASTDYPPYAQAAPLRNLLVWSLAQQGRYGLHAAAVGDSQGVALIVGNGGAGKSTTASACLHAGLTYLGDDFCVLDFDPTPCVHSLYSSGKLCDDSRQWLKPSTLVQSGLRDQHKTVYQWYPAFATQLPHSLPIRAILLPTISPAGETSVRPATPGETFTALATTTVRVMSLPTSRFRPLLGAIRRLVGQVPAYHLALGRDLAQIPPQILQVLEQNRP